MLGILPNIEQKYWRGFNISSGKMSRTAFERSMLGCFSNAESVDFFFKQRFEFFNNKWKKKVWLGTVQTACRKGRILLQDPAGATHE